MGTAIIELNDSAITCQHGETSLTMPGYALLTEQGVITGDKARQQAWLLPQQSHNQYWHQLNLSPLAGANAHARHHADLAYAQLQSLYREVGKPENVIFAVPGNFTHDQLSILLGLVKASPFSASGLVDSAVAAACHADLSGDLIHIDIQLHTSVLTRLACGDRISRVHTAQYPDVSLKGFYDTWAYFIADKFISQYRYDPMHTAQGEQQLRNLLPTWLTQLTNAVEIEVELAAQQGNFKLNILRNELVAANSQRWQRLAHALASSTSEGGQADTVLISHRIKALPGVKDYIEYSDYSEPEAVIDACVTQARHIISDSGSLAFVTELPLLNSTDTNKKPVPAPAPNSAKQVPQLPSHLLYRHQAYGLHHNLRIAMSTEGLNIDVLKKTNSSVRALARHSGQLLIEHNENKIVLHTNQDKLPIKCSCDLDNLKVGDEITIQDETLKFIEVL